MFFPLNYEDNLISNITHFFKNSTLHHPVNYTTISLVQNTPWCKYYQCTFMRKITKIKAKYYSKEILKYLLLAGAIYIAASSPYFVLSLMKNILKSTAPKRKFTYAFNYLKKRGLIEIKKEGHDVIIHLTKEGRKRAGKYQIDDLEIEKSKKWDKKWRMVIFDIPATSRLIRDIFRRKLKEFGFYLLQKSVWIYPYPCKEEIELLREFLGLDRRQIQVLEVTKLENERFLRKHFHL